MADITNDPLADLLLGNDGADYGTDLVRSMVCTAWDPVTRANTVSDGAFTYTNLGCIAPSLMSTGRVAVLQTGGRPIILGPLFFPTV